MFPVCSNVFFLQILARSALRTVWRYFRREDWPMCNVHCAALAHQVPSVIFVASDKIRIASGSACENCRINSSRAIMSVFFSHLELPYPLFVSLINFLFISFSLHCFYVHIYSCRSDVVRLIAKWPNLLPNDYCRTLFSNPDQSMAINWFCFYCRTFFHKTINPMALWSERKNTYY